MRYNAQASGHTYVTELLLKEAENNYVWQVALSVFTLDGSGIHMFCI